MRAWNFSAGPAALPLPVIERARENLLGWRGTGAGIAEISHRSPAFLARAEEIEAALRQLLGVPESHAVLLMAGGATLQQALVALNLAQAGQAADYLDTGHWSRVAMRQAQTYADVAPVASSAAAGDTRVPARDGWRLREGSAYLHLTANETIGGVELGAAFPVVDAPLVVDASSNIASRGMDIARVGLIYAGAQKNLGAAGITLVIIDRALLMREGQPRAPMLDYRAHAQAGSMLNTPPVWNWHVLGLCVEWMLAEGGVAEFAERSARKAALMYGCIDGSGGFYANTVDVACRSRMNVPFGLRDTALDSVFLEQAHAAGLIGLKGHKAVGGMRASLYNAMPLEGVAVLVDFMKEFERRHG